MASTRRTSPARPSWRIRDVAQTTEGLYPNKKIAELKVEPPPSAREAFCRPPIPRTR